MEKYLKQIINIISLDEWIIFAVSIYVGYKFKVLLGVILSILYLWIKLKYYEGRILNDYQNIEEIEYQTSSNPDLPTALAGRKINYETRPYYLKIQRDFEIKRKFLIDKLAIITFIGLLLVDKL